MVPLASLGFMQSLWNSKLSLNFTDILSAQFYRPKTSALNNVCLHQYQWKNMSLLFQRNEEYHNPAYKHKNVKLKRKSQGVEYCVLSHPVLVCISFKAFNWKGFKVKKYVPQRKQPSFCLFPLRYAFWIKINQSQKGQQNFGSFSIAGKIWKNLKRAR